MNDIANIAKLRKQTALSSAARYIGLHEIPGDLHSPEIMDMLQLDNSWPQADEVPWCSAFANWIAFCMGLPRSKSLRARSWLRVGSPVDLPAAEAGFDIVIIKRGAGIQPGPEVIEAPGHVFFYAGQRGGYIQGIGGNQHDKVCIGIYPISSLLGIRRLKD